jgi:WavE lipopolysaccharide synthesis
MIRDDQITVVVQGDVRFGTSLVLQKIRASVPGARIIFSTFAGLVTPSQREALESLVDQWVWSTDPGPMPPTVRSPTAPPNNINRQLRSTSAGLAHVRSPYVLKLRSDAQVNVRSIADLWWRESQAVGARRRMLFPSLYTRHPCGINGYLFHVSDWLCFGVAEQVRDYWSAPAFSEEDATWFDNHAHVAGSTATARRFRARLTQEQWIACSYARRRGYQVPEFLDQRHSALLDSYRAFLARECVIADSRQIDLLVPTHAWAERAAFQRLDCTSHRDWRRQVAAVAGAGNQPLEPMRWLARSGRHMISRGILVNKWIKHRLARHSSSASKKLQRVEREC